MEKIKIKIIRWLYTKCSHYLIHHDVHFYLNLDDDFWNEDDII